MNLRIVFKLLACLTLCVSTNSVFAATLDPDPDLILVNGKIVTVDADFTIAEAVAVKDGRFVGVGTAGEIQALAGPETEVIDLDGRTVVPGFIDGHAHMDREGLKFLQPSLSQARSIDEVLDVIARQVAQTPPGEWIVTMPLGDYPYYSGGPELMREGRYPNRQDLDRVAPDNPVYIRGPWFYWRSEPPIVSIANSRALELAGITAETEPPYPGIEIVRNPQTGEPTGVFLEDGPLGTMEFSLMKAAPRFTHAQRVAALRDSMRRYNAVGTTGVYEGHGISSVVLNAYRELWEQDAMTVRSTLVMSPAWDAAPDGKIDELLRDWSAYAAGNGIGDDMLKLNGIHAAVGRSAQLEIRSPERPYPGWAGYGTDQILPTERGSLYDLILASAKADLRPNAITVGPNIDRYLDVYERVNEEVPIADLRPVMIHVDFADEETLDRMKRLGVVPTILAGQLWKTGMAKTAGAGPEELETYIPLKRYVEKGIPFVLSTDNVPIDPLRALWAAVVRTDEATGTVITPGQKISREDALRALTINGAYLSFDENERGSIEPGKLADLAVLSEDVLAVPEDDIKDIKVLMTMVGGDIVYRAE